jgi:hypothetical protein
MFPRTVSFLDFFLCYGFIMFAFRFFSNLGRKPFLYSDLFFPVVSHFLLKIIEKWLSTEKINNIIAY